MKWLFCCIIFFAAAIYGGCRKEQPQYAFTNAKPVNSGSRMDSDVPGYTSGEISKMDMYEEGAAVKKDTYEPIVRPEDESVTMPYEEDEISSEEYMYTTYGDDNASGISKERQQSMPEVQDEEVRDEALPQSMPLEANE